MYKLWQWFTFTFSSREMPCLWSSLHRVETSSQAVPAKMATHIPETSSAHYLIKWHISLPSPALISLLIHPIERGLFRPIILINLVVPTSLLPLDPLQVFSASGKILYGYCCVSATHVYNSSYYTPGVRKKRQPCYPSSGTLFHLAP